MQEMISIGKIINFHGIMGEARVGYSNAARIKNAKTVTVKGNVLEIESVRFHKNFAIVKFKGIDNINDLLELKGENVYVSKEEVVSQLEKNEFLITDLVGLNVFDDKDDVIGTVLGIEGNSENNILTVKTQSGKNILIPFVKELVPIVDIKGKKIVVKPIEGLLS